jgi:hypothetical protein
MATEIDELAKPVLSAVLLKTRILTAVLCERAQLENVQTILDHAHLLEKQGFTERASEIRKWVETLLKSDGVQQILAPAPALPAPEKPGALPAPTPQDPPKRGPGRPRKEIQNAEHNTPSGQGDQGTPIRREGEDRS